MTILEILFLFLIGSISGILSGLLGIGGGVILVPSLLFFFHVLDFPKDILMQFALATSLATIMFSNFFTSIIQALKKNVLWRYIPFFIPGILAGVFLGVYTVHLLPSYFLSKIFSIFLLLLSIHLFFSFDLHFHLKNNFPLIPIGSVLGFFSALLGIGGGTLCLPTLESLDIPMKKSIGISSLITFLTAFSGSVSYFLLGWHFGLKYKLSIGFVYLPGFLFLGLASSFFAPLGVKLENFFSEKTLKKTFSFILFLTAIWMFFR